MMTFGNPNDDERPVSMLREGMRAWLKNPCTADEEIVIGDPPPQKSTGKPMRIIKIGYDTKTVTFE